MTLWNESEFDYDGNEAVIENNLLDTYQLMYKKWIMVCYKTDNEEGESSDT